MSADDEVREASGRFYAALSRMAQGSIGAMDDLWSHGAGSTAMHPIAGREVSGPAAADRRRVRRNRHLSSERSKSGTG